MIQKLTDMLMATMVVCLCMGVVSCKDDDDDENNEQEVGGKTEMSASANDDAAVLTTLLKYLCEYDSEEIDPAILTQTFEPTIGTVDDESQPTVRTVVAGTIDEADAIAARLLCSLGISNSQPNGFQFSNDAIGSASYQHGTGDELAAITLGVKQIPHLTKIVFTATAKDNANKKPYYHVGDVAWFKYKLYICVSSQGKKNPILTWIHFDQFSNVQQQEISTKSCKWLMTGNDVYYNGKMADRQALADWMKNILFKQDVYDELSYQLRQISINWKRGRVSEVLPENQDRYTELVEECLIKSPDSLVWEAWQPVNGENTPRFLMNEEDVETVKSTSNWEIKRYSPLGLMLCDQMRWSGVFDMHNYWVPYICLVKDGDKAQQLKEALNQTPSMTTLNPSHFKWQDLGSVMYKNEKYNIYAVAIHWTHEPYTLPGDDDFKYYGLIDFSGYIPDSFEKLYSVRNITSSWMSFTDDGTEKKGLLVASIETNL